MEMDLDALQYIIEHVFLPPHLPQRSDPEFVRKETFLLDTLLEAVDSFVDMLQHMGTSQATIPIWAHLQTMLRNMVSLHNSEDISQDVIGELLRGMHMGDVLPIHIRSQNAGVIIRMKAPHQMTFEAFEASLPCETILQARAKVRVTFPANPRLSFPADPNFYRPLSNVLSYLTNTEMSDAVPTTRKGGNVLHEIRDTPSPRFITEALAGVIRAFPTDEASVPTEFVHKRLDDHVLWKSALKPWRRSPLWLIVRVALQTTLNENGIVGTEGYKAFLCHFMTCVLQYAVRADPSHFGLDILHHMKAKIARRLSKLGALVRNEDQLVINLENSAIKTLNGTLERRWRDMRQSFSSTKQWEEPDPSLYHGCTTIRFLGANGYLKKVIDRQGVIPGGETRHSDTETIQRLRPLSLCRLLMSTNTLPNLIMKKKHRKETEVYLFDIEVWVDSHLPSWKASARPVADILSLHQLIKGYRQIAAIQYTGKPERLSLMHLCILELWVALDQLVIHWCPLLAEYSPEIPENFLDPLLLPHLSQLRRLWDVQQYLRSRHEKAQLYGSRSIFSDIDSTLSFASRFFDTPLGAPLVNLEGHIRLSSSAQIQEKLEELDGLNQKYEMLVAKANQLSCTRTSGKQKQCTCPKCQLLKSAKALRIVPFEEPLPPSSRSRHIVFELDCPAPFAAWREATFNILSSACPADLPISLKDAYPLSKYKPLQSFLRPDRARYRITLASSTKSIHRSHYGQGRPIPAKAEDVILKHAGQFRLYHKSRAWVKPIEDATIQPECVFKMEGLYETLQSYVGGTTHSPNAVLASIIHCPVDLTFREFISFGQLRSGNRVQWRNLMRAIRSQSLSFSDPSVFSLVLQTIWQAGPAEVIDDPENGGIYREAHQDLLEIGFTAQMVDELSSALDLLQENWKQLLQLAIIVVIALRVHSLSPHPSIKESARGLLLRSRALAARWIESIIKSEHDSSVGEYSAQIESMRQNSASTAVVLRATYDFDNGELQNAFTQRDQVVLFLYAGYLISNFRGSWPKGISHLAQRDLRIGLKLQTAISDALMNDTTILASLVSRQLDRTFRGIEGSPLASPADRWWHIDVIGDDEPYKYSVHVNVVNGETLINGEPAQVLPLRITQHPSYKLLFPDHQFFKVRPSGMSLECEFRGSKVRFTMLEDQLIIHREMGGEIQEYIPAKQLIEDLPTCIVEAHHHWYSPSRFTIEMYPQDRTWKTGTPTTWHIALHSTTEGISGRMQRRSLDGVQYGIDVHSGLYEHLSHTLRPIEPDSRGFLVVIETVDEAAMTPTIFVPRHNLTFSLNASNQLECQSTPGYVIDTDRSSLPTLFGLQNLLCLRHGLSSMLFRKVIIPKGRITAQYGEFGHPVVTIDASQSNGCFVYTVDALVGRLVGSRSMESDLYVVKLHAFTSSPFPDPLLRRSGTSEALYRLRSASSYPSNELSPFSKQILEDLSLLTPRRTFYPEHLKVMETVRWNDSLPPTSQHILFQPLVEGIMDYWRRMSPFHQEEAVESTTRAEDQSELLNNRIASRDWALESDPYQYDGHGRSRGSLRCSNSQTRESIAYKIARATQSPNELPENPAVAQDIYKWAVVTGDKHWKWQNIQYWLPPDGEPSPPDVWVSLYCLCRSTPPWLLFDAAMALSFLGYRGMGLNLVSSLIRSIQSPRFSQRDIFLPSFDVVDLSINSQFNNTAITGLIREVQVGFENSVYFQSFGGHDCDDSASLTRARSKYEASLAQQVNKVVTKIKKSWPNVSFSSVLQNDALLSRSKYQTIVQPALDRWVNNHQFREFVNQFHHPTLSSKVFSVQLYQPHVPSHLISRNQVCLVSLDGLISKRCTPLTTTTTPTISPKQSSSEATQGVTSHLHRLLEGLARQSYSTMCSHYLDDLWRSAEAHSRMNQQPRSDFDPTLDFQLLEARQRAGATRVGSLFDSIHSTLSPRSPREEMMCLAGLWPDISPRVLLRLLSVKNRTRASNEWVRYLICYGISIRDSMRLDRMLEYHLSKRDAQLLAECQWSQQWDVFKFPEWILIEIDANFAIRGVQSDVAFKMLFPDGDRNAVMQLNMGEGKSSVRLSPFHSDASDIRLQVIIPIVASSATSGNGLVRVIVPRAQSKQQLHILRRTLTDLCDHRVFLLPFHRTLSLDHQSAVDIALHLHQSASSGSIWLCEPEQILSLRLLGVDRITNQTKRDIETGRELVRLQQWLDKSTRDILDESDEILHARQQVIYTMGDRQDLEGSSLRWETPQKLLGLFLKYLISEGLDNRAIWIHKRDHGFAFPQIRCQSDDVRQIINSFICNSIRSNEWMIPQHLKESAIDFVTSNLPSDRSRRLIDAYCAEEKEEGEPNDRFIHTLMILRGLIRCGLLLHALKDKRWRVNYGLDLGRTQLAVPYRAKDYPSQRSEFGHPDLTILLTCLSYYYGGLNDDMLEKLIRRLLKSNTPDLTYTEWLRSCWHQVSPDLRTIHGINVEDKALLKARLFPLLRYNKSTIDFYLNTLVFPRSAKEYPWKLSSSGWDLARKKQRSTTGFSGTNDIRFLLPVTISQMDNSVHLHTNATVLSHLLQEENNAVVRHPTNLPSVDILKLTMGHPSKPTVILDVGAQILDRSNLDFVTMWLSLHEDHTRIRAAIYFDEKGDLMVVSRDGTIQTLLDSPYSERLDQCLTYLDEAHTRGTDLRLPDSCAVVTLGPRLTKDKLVQGCMRMRRLGNGHRLVFFMPDEVAMLVQEGDADSRQSLKTFNVVGWSIRETWRQMHVDISTWAMQGYSFASREEGWRQMAERSLSNSTVANLFYEQEGRTLASLYANFTHSTAPWDVNQAPARGIQNQLLRTINQRCKEFGGLNSQMTSISEEKEIEMVHEKEQEREVQRAPSATPLEHQLHPRLVKWVKNGGRLPLNSAVFPAQDALKGTTLDSQPRGFRDLFSSLYVTIDFCRVIQPKYAEAMNRFMRPVEWIVTPNTGTSSFMVLISPFEANALMPLFRRTSRLRLSPFAPRNNISMHSLEDLTWFTVCGNPINVALPRQMVVPLNLFAGALFIRDQATYRYICMALRLYVDPDPLPDHLLDKLTPVGYVWHDGARAELGMTGPGFTMNAVFFFRRLLRFRRCERFGS
ncbi:hypothetical protein FRC17_006582 [Serendipita sp. 399]|nr:hypothetical protein FRC17_006582 [Serendipita sp. 399]